MLPERITVILEEEERQAVILALAHLAVNRPGWEDMLKKIAYRMDNHDIAGRPIMFDKLKELEQARLKK